MNRLPIGIGVLLLATVAGAQEVSRDAQSGAITIPRGLMTTKLTGCRDTAWLSEGHFSRELYPFLVLWNPLPVEQRVEAQVFSPLTGAAPAVVAVAPLQPFERRALDWFELQRQYSSLFRAYAVSVRFEYVGSAHLITWRVPDIFTTPFYDWAAWIRAWRVELLSPVRHVVVCIG